MDRVRGRAGVAPVRLLESERHLGCDQLLPYPLLAPGDRSGARVESRDVLSVRPDSNGQQAEGWFRGIHVLPPDQTAAAVVEGHAAAALDEVLPTPTLKHAGAKTITLRASQTDSELDIRIEVDGRGHVLPAAGVCFAGGGPCIAERVAERCRVERQLWLVVYADFGPARHPPA